VQLFQQPLPHRLPDELLHEAARIARVPAALYLVGLDGSCLVRLTGEDSFPELLPAPQALGPEVAPESYPELNRALQKRLPGSVATPMRLYGRAVGFILTAASPAASLASFADQAASALELAAGYTDVFAAARRTQPITPAAEIQQDLLPPRIAQLAGAELAATLIPTYEVGGDWFDYAENPHGTWLAIADGIGKGPRAGALAAVALAALRAARRNGADLGEAASNVDGVVKEAFGSSHFVTAILGLWRPDDGEFRWLTFGHPRPLLVHLNGELEELDDAVNCPLGLLPGDDDHRPAVRRLHPGERLILYSDGVTERRAADGEQLGLDGLRAALARAGASAVSTVAALAAAVDAASTAPLRDDATIMVLAPMGPR
jgi:hypothetical protein